MQTALADVIAGTLLLGVTAYSTAGGVDFGAGIWDLLAGRSPRGKQASELVDLAMAPVWEMNNVWLVFSIVVCWTGFPALFQAAFESLYPIYAIALLGLILRGAFFAFRHVATGPRNRRIADLVFGCSSLLTPFCFAATLGALASGEVTPQGPLHSVWQACVNPMSISFGLVSLAATAFSGGSFLVGDARRHRNAELAEYFGRRAAAAAAALIVLGAVGLVCIGIEAPALLHSMLLGPGLPFALLAVVLTPAVAVLLVRRVYRWYRTLAVGAVVGLVLAWGFGQAPYLLPGRMTIAAAAAPTSSEVLLLVVAVVVVLVIAPSIALLVRLDQGGALESPG